MNKYRNSFITTLFFSIFFNNISFANTDLVKFTNNNSDNFSAKTILEKMIEADKKNLVFQATFSNYSMGDMKNGKHTGVIREETITAKMTFKKPYKAILKVIDSPDYMARGATLLYLGGEKVKVRAAGIWGLFPITFNVNDPMFENARGHKPLTAMIGLDRIIRNDAKVEVIGMTEINHRKAYTLRVETPQKLDPQITHEIYRVDSSNFIVLSAEMFVNNKMVSQYKVKDIKTNLSISDDFFKL